MACSALLFSEVIRNTNLYSHGLGHPIRDASGSGDRPRAPALVSHMAAPDLQTTLDDPPRGENHLGRCVFLTFWVQIQTAQGPCIGSGPFFLRKEQVDGPTGGWTRGWQDPPRKSVRYLVSPEAST
jgi:hypothetical protein